MGRRKKDEKIGVIVHYPENFDKKEFDERYKDFIYNCITMILQNKQNAK